MKKLPAIWSIPPRFREMKLKTLARKLEKSARRLRTLAVLERIAPDVRQRATERRLITRHIHIVGELHDMLLRLNERPVKQGPYRLIRAQRIVK